MKCSKLFVVSLLALSISTSSAVKAGGLYSDTVTGSNTISIDHDKEYKACIQVASTKPETALKASQYWMTQGGGAGAKHCQAVAMLNLKQYSAAALLLEDVATSQKATISPGQRSSLLAEAASAYKMAGQASKGLPLLDQAVDLSPNSIEYYIQRGVLLAVVKNYPKAVADFSKVIAINPQYAPAYTYRANTFRYLGRLNEAMADVNVAAGLVPNNTDTLLERGVLHALKGDKLAAAQDWQKILLIASSNDPAADAARANLERLKSS